MQEAAVRFEDALVSLGEYVSVIIKNNPVPMISRKNAAAYILFLNNCFDFRSIPTEPVVTISQIIKPDASGNAAL
jgi:mannitol-specific phosphotransferase system IIBC component